jgi:uncharacterized protein YndB with AHSA1/START domain
MAAVPSTGTAIATLPTDQQVLVSREIDAPKDLVYRAWTSPELVKRWWSGRQGEVTLAEIDLRVGGKWRQITVMDGGFEIGLHGEYREVVPNERIVSTEIYEGTPAGDAQSGAATEQHVMLHTVTFTDVDGRTMLRLLIECPSKNERDAIVNSWVNVGMQEQWDLLEQVAVSLR